MTYNNNNIKLEKRLHTPKYDKKENPQVWDAGLMCAQIGIYPSKKNKLKQ